jgi:DNA-binding beta-propeller fold protein YncE
VSVSVHSIKLALALVVVVFCAISVPTVTAADDQGHVVVANRGSGTVSVIDVATDTATTVSLPGPNAAEPMYVVDSPAGGRVFVGDRSNDRVVVLRSSDFSVEGTVAAGRGVFHMWASPNSDQLWVNNDIDKTITVIDVITLDVIATVPLPADLVAMGGKPHDVVLEQNGSSVFVTMLGFAGPGDYVVKYDTGTFMETGRALVGKDPHVSLARQNDLLYVPCQNTNEVIVLDRETLDEVDSLPVPGAHGAGMSRNGKVFYTTNLPGGGIDGLFAIDTSTNSVIGDPADTPAAVPHNLALTPNGKKIYVTHSGAANSVVTVYTATRQDVAPSYLTSVTVGTNPFGLAYVP